VNGQLIPLRSKATKQQRVADNKTIENLGQVAA
jgi:hypothetical protein